jgi:uncharacterized protein
MKVLIDIGHPAHVHLFKHFARKMIDSGHQVLFTVRDKDFEIALLEHEGFFYKNFGKHYKTRTGKLIGLIKYSWLIITTSLKFKPDVFLSHGSVYTALASFFYRRPNIALEDTGNWEQVGIYKPFTDVILTSTSFRKRYGHKQIFYSGYHELAYLHPNYFTPDKSILSELDVSAGERFFVLRFVSWNASHDAGQHGLSLEDKRQLIFLLNQYGKVFISSEQKLQAEFESFRYMLPPQKMHDVLAFADLFIGEGASMASECAMLGTPAVYVNSLEAGSIDEQEKYGLLWHYRRGENIIGKVRELIMDSELKKRHLEARNKMLAEKIDITAFLLWFVQNYPESKRTMKENPDYQNNFI